MKTLPYLHKTGNLTTLYVDEAPYVALAGEIHNSSSSNLTYMRDKVWPQLRGLHLNTVIAPVFWELVEPAPGEFDFTLVTGLIEQARVENVRLVLLWFGLWKNGLSTYVPGWVKKDYTTYFKARFAGNTASESISPFCEAAVQADANAFQQLMYHLKKIDENQHTVIMVQVENEIGFLDSERDFSEAANQEFIKLVPANIAEAFGKTGTWSDVFGEDASEYFMAYHYATAVELITKAGTEAYALPMFVNAWLEQFPERAGSYPSGGPIAKVMKMWQLAAPTICLYAPDIYLPSFKEICEEYTQDGNPLFIPEARRDLVSATNVFYAIGKHNALCFSPFGIEDFLADPQDEAVDLSILTALNIEQSGFILNGTGPYLAQSYKLLSSMMGIIHRYRGTGKMTGFLQSRDKGCLLAFTKYDLKITYLPAEEGKPIGGGLIIETSENEFILAGIGFSADFLPKRGEQLQVGYVRIEEGSFDQEAWTRGRVLNGDEGAYGGIKIGRNPHALCVEVYKYF
ncbi:hypothetical protein EHS13_33775 [Paenibacillus psychroresistens]|uniref:Beta-galactosidase n=1 Tax=Paenibacillus psychroresistens TaxID=1778678 RepID=A0A6B8RUK0_9BACL|nr:DUF5597 domain-containing protein [Paenibacillus psychroresistens]QGQ99479.1 hypothetical protein EHS13_33775 [Paenibacillus psychroresistens]